METKKKAIKTIEIVTKTALSGFPVGGTLITSVYDAIKENCLSKRQEKWKKTVEEHLAKLDNTLEDIGNNELFTTALVKATEMAIKTSREEKFNYLANAVVNSLKPNMDEERLIMFLNILDKYTVSHIKIIYFFNNPKRFDEISIDSYYAGSPTTPLFQVYPELNNELFEKICKDLYYDGMLSTDNFNTMMTVSGMLAKRTTSLGDAFLNFIQQDFNVD